MRSLSRVRNADNEFRGEASPAGEAQEQPNLFTCYTVFRGHNGETPYSARCYRHFPRETHIVGTTVILRLCKIKHARQKNMNKTIVAVWHSGSKGKTSTLRAVATHLLRIYPSHKILHGSIPPAGDFSLVVSINRQVIAVESRGDPRTQLLERLQDIAVKFKPDIIFCTTRTKGDTIQAVETIEKNHGYEAIWTSTYQTSSNQAAANDLKGQHLIALLQGLGII